MGATPIFLFSVSRSGSTLVQRILAAHEGVSTVSEPWILLPFIYATRPEGVLAEYVHPLMVDAITDFCAELPGGPAEYRVEAHDFAMRLYDKATEPGSRYFLDKSPPYCLIAEEIMQLFPEGKFVFLWRNPLSIISSMIETWLGGHWHPTMYRSDLFSGLPRLIAAYDANPSRAHSVRFENLVADDDDQWKQLTSYLGIKFDPRTLETFSSVELRGRMGDPTGTKRYTRLSADPAQKWRRTLNNPIRKAWCRRYLRFLGQDRLAVMGYPLDGLIAELDAQPSGTTSLGGDLGRMVADLAKEPLRVRAQQSGLGGPNIIRALLGA
jgi:hypothetical protein